MIKTPYLKPFNTQGGTLYVFPSVSRDLTKTFVSNDYEFKFSHFACLNIPNICEGKYSEGSKENDKGLYIETLMNNSLSNWSSDSICDAITENLQNYVMNFETAILNGEGDDDGYDPDVLTTVSEKVFWNWMQKVGAIKFTESGTAEDSKSIIERTVQYIGNIDIMNTVEINGDAYEELYIHIPSTVGASTNVYFRTGDMTDNKNYLNTKYEITNNGHSECIQGRTDTDAIYDKDAGENCYTGDIGHTIDFRDSNYDAGMGINNMNSKSLEDFEFNAVLIYYDIYEKTNKPDVKRVATNLYGILFLDDVSVEGGKTYIQRYPKKKETVYGNGNSYALKIDLKVSTFRDDNTSYVDSDDMDTIKTSDGTSMSLYMRSLEQLQKCIDIFYTQKQQIVKLSERISTIENLVMGIDSISSLREAVINLNNRIEESSNIDTATLQGLIENNSKRIENIMNGGKDLKLQFDTDVIQAGTGIGLQKSLNKVVINSEQKYSINSVYNSSSDNNEEINIGNPISSIAETKKCMIHLNPGENFAVIHISDDGDSSSNFMIDIDDENCQWEVGQSLKILFDCVNGGSFNFDSAYIDTIGIIISPSKSNSNIEISGREFEGNNLIEIICIGKDSNDTKRFIYLIK